jgi:Domain of unknown function (DUF4349)
MKRPRLLPLLVLLLLVSAAIGGLFLRERSRERGMAFSRPSGGSGLMMETRAPQAAARPAAAESSRDALEVMVAARRLVRNASVTLEVPLYGDAVARAEAIATAQGGYLSDAHVARDSGDRQSGTLTLRVRADRFEEALRALERLGKVESASLETQDVGKEYLDLETRLSAKRDAEERLRAILRTKTARLSDVLEAEKELSRVIEERETMEGERRFYDRQLALSTITAELHEPQPFLRGSAVAPLREALGRALPLLSGSAAALLYAAAAALPWVLLAFVVWRLHRRFSTRRVVRLAMDR